MPWGADGQKTRSFDLGAPAPEVTARETEREMCVVFFCTVLRPVCLLVWALRAANRLGRKLAQK